jgi:PAS domain-containing protein
VSEVQEGPGALAPAAEPRAEQTSEVERAQALVDQAAQALAERDNEIWQMQAVLERLLSSCSPLAVVEDGVVRAWSRSLEQVTGVPARSAVGRRLPRVMKAPLIDGETWRDGRGATWSIEVDGDEAWQVVSFTRDSTVDLRS